MLQSDSWQGKASLQIGGYWLINVSTDYEYAELPLFESNKLFRPITQDNQLLSNFWAVLFIQWYDMVKAGQDGHL